MEYKLSKILSQYRHYQADQVLTHTQLNETIAYFEDQDRLTRIGLTGVGIVNGLKLSLENNGGQTTISIHQGYGITTDGDLLTLYQTLEEGSNKEKTIDITSLSFTHYRPFEDDKAVYRPFFYDEEGQYQLSELCQSTDDDAEPLSGVSEIDEKVFLLYLESYPKDQDICGDINCDNQGIEQIAKLRYLMVDEEVAATICSHDAVYQQFSQIQETLEDLNYLQLLKIVVNESNAQTHLQLDRLYREAIIQGNTVQDFSTGMQAILSGFSFIWEGDETIANLANNLDNLLDPHFSFSNTSTFQFNQYRYGLLRDLLQVYHTLIGELKAFRTVENPDIKSFPKHLLLGRLDGNGYRHAFYASPAITDYATVVSRIKSNFRKIFYLLSAFDFNPDRGTRIIPTVINPDSLQVPGIPFYYRNVDGLMENWSVNSFIRPNSYHYELGNNPLLTENTKQDFYWIGGHLGTPGEDTFQSLKSMVKQFGLDFEVYHFDIQQQSSAYRRFLQEHPSCSHLAGVPRAGTYLLLSSGDRVIGDLALPYRVVNVNAQASTSHIKVAECRYPWISTLKYLNNLSRSIRGSRRRAGLMPENYRLVIREYQINGFSIITGPTVLEIPLETILYRRMHAITEALNERFPNGLVFDFNESLKRFVIIRAFDDEFRITFADTTLSLNNPAFTYTQDGMFRSDNLFRLDSMRFEERRKYRETTYRQLQGEFAPVNKDDDNGEYAGRWREWYRLIHALDNYNDSRVRPRFITSGRDLPPSVDRIISRIKTDLSASGINHALYLTGDWLDGSWVSSEMLRNYNANSSANNVVVRFLRLRRLLHRKENATKASLFVVLSREIDRPAMEQRMRKWVDLADIYIEGPSMSGRRRLIDSINRVSL